MQQGYSKQFITGGAVRKPRIQTRTTLPVRVVRTSSVSVESALWHLDPPVIHSVTLKHASRHRRRLPLYAAVFLVGVSFLAGMWFTLRTDKSFADTEAQNASAPGAIPIEANNLSLGPATRSASTNALFTMTLE